MTTVQIFGVAPSSYVRTTRMACVEKGIEHTLEPVDFGSASHLALHPYGRVPAMKHGDVHLVESSAIAFYLDAGFDGPSLVPADAVALGQMHQALSVFNCYVYNDIVGQYLLPIIRKQANAESIAAALPNVQKGLEWIEAKLEGRDYLAGNALSVADLTWGPAVAGLGHFPETGKLIESLPNFRGWVSRLKQRKSAEFLYPPRG